MGSSSKRNKSTAFKSCEAATNVDEQAAINILGCSQDCAEIFEEEALKPGMVRDVVAKTERLIATVLSKENVLKECRKHDLALDGKRSDSMTGEHLYLLIMLMIAIASTGNRFSLEEFKARLAMIYSGHNVHVAGSSSFCRVFPEPLITRIFYLFSGTMYSFAENAATPMFDALPLESGLMSESEVFESAARAVWSDTGLERLNTLSPLLSKAYGTPMADQLLSEITLFLQKYVSENKDLSLIDLNDACIRNFISDKEFDLNRIKLLKTLTSLLNELKSGLYQLMKRLPPSELPLASALKFFGKDDAFAADGTLVSQNIDCLTPFSRGSAGSFLKMFAASSLMTSIPVLSQICSGVVSERAVFSSFKEEAAYYNALLMGDAGMYGSNLKDFAAEKGEHFLVRFQSSVNPVVTRVAKVKAHYDKTRRAYRNPMVTEITELNHTRMKEQKLESGYLYIFELAPDEYGDQVCMVVVPGHENNADDTVFATNLKMRFDNPVILSMQVIHLLVIYHYRWKVERYFLELKSNTSFELYGRMCPFFCASFMTGALINSLLQRCYGFVNALIWQVKSHEASDREEKLFMSRICPSFEKISRSTVVTSNFFDFLRLKVGFNYNCSVSKETAQKTIAERCRKTSLSEQNIARSYHAKRFGFTVPETYLNELIDGGYSSSMDLIMAVEAEMEAQAKTLNSVEVWINDYALRKLTEVNRSTRRLAIIAATARRHGYQLPFNEKELRYAVFHQLERDNLSKKDFRVIVEYAYILISKIEQEYKLESVLSA